MFTKCDTSAFGPDGVAGIRGILLPGNNWETGQVYEGIDFSVTAEKGTSEFLDARKGESGSTWDVTNMFIKRDYQEVISFYSTKDSHSLPRRVIHSEGLLSGPRSSLPVGYLAAGEHLCSCRLRPRQKQVYSVPWFVFLNRDIYTSQHAGSFCRNHEKWNAGCVCSTGWQAEKEISFCTVQISYNVHGICFQ